ncbi:hypothetical protein JCM24511_00569 [Saitozyma sp. JCM 24511]|nr:hypothetical protein JCM24511_00569 [Saitozyma sp. JCM 24511]
MAPPPAQARPAPHPLPSTVLAQTTSRPHLHSQQMDQIERDGDALALAAYIRAESQPGYQAHARAALPAHGHGHGQEYGRGQGGEEGMEMEKEQDPFLVVFEKDDPTDALNWTIKRKVLQTFVLIMATMYAGIGSAAFSPASSAVQETYNVGEVVGELANSMWSLWACFAHALALTQVIGFAFGPQVFGPLSELYGRKFPLVLGIFLSALFNIPTATAPNLATIMISRFFAGVFGAAPYAIAGGCFHDMLDPVHVQIGVAFFAVSTAGGPALGPVVGAGLVSTGADGWRWVGWYLLIFGLCISLLLQLFLAESYPPYLLQQRARAKRIETGQWAYHAELDGVVVTPKDIVWRYILRPTAMLVLEPMLLVITIYMSFVYALLYMLCAAVPLIFGTLRGLSPVVSVLPFVSIFIGILFGGGFIILDQRRYAAHLRRKGVGSDPEERFKPMGLGAVMLPIGLFWFAFTGPAQTDSVWPSIIALGFSMAGMILIFECGILYLIDIFPLTSANITASTATATATPLQPSPFHQRLMSMLLYKSFANSAIAANTLVRSLVGGSFPLFVPAMVRNLGYQSTWSMALLAFLAVGLAGIPFVFARIGERLRGMSKFKPGL